MSPQQRLQSALDHIVRRSQSADAGGVARARVALDATELEVIKLLGSLGVLAMRDLSVRLRIAASTATSLIDRMERKGLVVRDRNLADRRVIQLSLTPAGKAVLQEVSDEQARLCREMLAALAPTEQALLAEMMHRLAEPTPPSEGIEAAMERQHGSED
ncbi:MAG: hypothetical protein Kilf2KO_16930 [Rhodospirillales bacterium]